MNSFSDAHTEIFGNLFFIVLWLISSIWVYFDAKKIRAVTGNENFKPIAWLLGCLFLWIAAFPIYIYFRFIKK